MAKRFHPNRSPNGEYDTPYIKEEAGHVDEKRLVGILNHFELEAQPASDLEDDQLGFDLKLKDGTRVQLKTCKQEILDRERLRYLDKGVVLAQLSHQLLARAARPNGKVPPDCEVEAYTVLQEFKAQVEPFKELALKALRGKRVTEDEFTKAKEAMENFPTPPLHEDVPDQRVFSPFD